MSLFENSNIVCPNPNCGYVGKGQWRGGYSGCLAIIGLLFCVLPGIMYILMTGRRRLCCPKCGVQVR